MGVKVIKKPKPKPTKVQTIKKNVGKTPISKYILEEKEY